MIQKIISALLITILLISTAPAAVLANTPDESSYFYIVIDQATGAILMEQNSHNRIFPASTTKILTAYTALGNSGVTSIITASKVAAGPMESGAVRLGLSEGEEMQLYDMLMALMLKSANDVAVAVAEYIGGSVEGFSAMMNEKAAEAGAIDTNFVNPNGLHDDNHYTTPYDLAVITRKALENYNFASIVSKPQYTLPATNKRDKTLTIKNGNPILGENKGMDFLVTGVKTGYTSKAKYTLVSSAHDYTGREVVCVVANMPSRDISSEFSLKLMKKAFDDFSFQSITAAGSIVTNILPYDPGFDVASAMNIEYLLPRDESLWDLDIITDLYITKNSRPQRGEIVGKLTYFNKDLEIGSTYLVSADNLSYTLPKQIIPISKESGMEKAGFSLRFLIPLGLAIALTLLFLLLLRYNKKEIEE